MKLSGINRQCKGNNWAQNSSQLPSITPFFGYKHPLGGQKFLVAIFVERQIKLRREWFFSWCFFDDPIACKSLHNKSIKRNRPPAQERVAADVETQWWHQPTWHRDIQGHWENIMFVFFRISGFLSLFMKSEMVIWWKALNIGHFDQMTSYILIKYG